MVQRPTTETQQNPQPTLEAATQQVEDTQRVLHAEFARAKEQMEQIARDTQNDVLKLVETAEGVDIATQRTELAGLQRLLGLVERMAPEVLLNPEIFSSQFGRLRLARTGERTEMKPKNPLQRSMAKMMLGINKTMAMMGAATRAVKAGRSPFKKRNFSQQQEAMVALLQKSLVRPLRQYQHALAALERAYPGNDAVILNQERGEPVRVTRQETSFTEEYRETAWGGGHRAVLDSLSNHIDSGGNRVWQHFLIDGTWRTTEQAKQILQKIPKKEWSQRITSIRHADDGLGYSHERAKRLKSDKKKPDESSDENAIGQFGEGLKMVMKAVLSQQEKNPNFTMKYSSRDWEVRPKKRVDSVLKTVEMDHKTGKATKVEVQTDTIMEIETAYFSRTAEEIANGRDLGELSQEELLAVVNGENSMWGSQTQFDSPPQDVIEAALNIDTKLLAMRKNYRPIFQTKNVGIVSHTPMELREDKGLSGLYVHGVYVQELLGSMFFSYDIKTDCINNDRNNVEHGAVLDAITEAMTHLNDPKLMRKMLQHAQDHPIMMMMEYNSLHESKHKDLWVQQFAKQFGKNAYVVTDPPPSDEMLELINEQGYTPIEMQLQMKSFLSEAGVPTANLLLPENVIEFHAIKKDIHMAKRQFTPVQTMGDLAQNHELTDSGATRTIKQYRLKTDPEGQFRPGLPPMSIHSSYIAQIQLADDGRGYESKNLHIETGSKQNDDTAKGKYGRGMKDGIAASLGRGVVVSCASRNWTARPRVKTIEGVDMPQLTLEYRTKNKSGNLLVKGKEMDATEAASDFNQRRNKQTTDFDRFVAMSTTTMESDGTIKGDAAFAEYVNAFRGLRYSLLHERENQTSNIIQEGVHTERKENGWHETQLLNFESEKRLQIDTADIFYDAALEEAVLTVGESEKLLALTRSTMVRPQDIEPFKKHEKLYEYLQIVMKQYTERKQFEQLKPKYNPIYVKGMLVPSDHNTAFSYHFTEDLIENAARNSINPVLLKNKLAQFWNKTRYRAVNDYMQHIAKRGFLKAEPKLEFTLSLSPEHKQHWFGAFQNQFGPSALIADVNELDTEKKNEMEKKGYKVVPLPTPVYNTMYNAGVSDYQKVKKSFNDRTETVEFERLELPEQGKLNEIKQMVRILSDRFNFSLPNVKLYEYKDRVLPAYQNETTLTETNRDTIFLHHSLLEKDQATAMRAALYAISQFAGRNVLKNGDYHSKTNLRTSAMAALTIDALLASIAEEQQKDEPLQPDIQKNEQEELQPTSKPKDMLAPTRLLRRLMKW